MLAGYVISVVTQLYFCHTLPDTFVKTCLSSGASLDDPLPPWPSVCFKNSLLFVGCLVSQQHARVSQGWIYTDNFTCCHSEMQAADDRVGSTQTILRAATPRYKLQMKLSTSPSHSILPPGQPVPVLALYHQAPGRIATGVPIFKSLVWLEPGFPGLEADALTTRPARQRSRTKGWRIAPLPPFHPPPPYPPAPHLAFSTWVILMT